MAAPVPSAGEHCAFRSILVLRARFGAPWTDAYVSRLSQENLHNSQNREARNRRKRTRSMEQAHGPSLEETYDEHAIGANIVCGRPNHRGAHKRRIRPARREARQGGLPYLM